MSITKNDLLQRLIFITFYIIKRNDDHLNKNIFIGYTKNDLKYIKYNHYSRCNNKNSLYYNSNLYQYIRLNGGIENFTFNIIETKQFKNKKEIITYFQNILDTIKPKLNMKKYISYLNSIEKNDILDFEKINNSVDKIPFKEDNNFYIEYEDNFSENSDDIGLVDDNIILTDKTQVLENIILTDKTQVLEKVYTPSINYKKKFIINFQNNITQKPHIYKILNNTIEKNEIFRDLVLQYPLILVQTDILTDPKETPFIKFCMKNTTSNKADIKITAYISKDKNFIRNIVSFIDLIVI